jgi:hypothetical protein
MIITLGFSPATTLAQGTAFSYQGRLNDGANNADGIYDVRFAIYDALTLGTQQGPILTNSATAVSNGLFTATLDFGNQFPGADRWLEIGVRTNGGGGFVTLSPRQQITATPYAMRAAGANFAATVSGMIINTNLSSTAFGFNTTASESASTAFGQGSVASGAIATAMGNNTAAGGLAATAMGRSTTASGGSSTAMGRNTVAGGDNSTAIGRFSTANGLDATAMGHQTVASGAQSTAMGESTTASGIASMSAGTQARAIHDGSFVWADYNFADFTSTATNQFLIRAAGGVGINTNNPNGAALAVNGNVSAASVMTPEVRSAGNGPLELYVNNQRGLRLEPTSDEDTVNVIGGSALNLVGAGVVGATIAGGGKGFTGPFGGGAHPNQVEGDYSTVSGGIGHTIGANGATIGGGSGNIIETSASIATISGGSGNRIQTNSYSATIGGGGANTIQPNALYSTIGGGSQNTIQTSGEYATIPGGRLNSAADYAFAAGFRATANHTGAFVWGDFTDADFASTANNQFLIRAAGGVGINKNNPASALDVNGTVTASGFSGPGGSTRIQGADNWDVNNTEGDFRVGNDVQRFKIGVATGGGGAGDVWMRAQGGTARVFIKTPGGTTFFSNEGQTAGVSLAANGTAWAVVSDRNVKKDIAPVDQRAILEKLAALPVTQWHYQWESPEVTPHIGPMAQDFKAAFYPGTDDKSITTQEADGVALAAIQGLNQKLEETRAENTELKQQLSELKRLVQTLVTKQ